MNFDGVLRILFALSTISCQDPTVNEVRSSLLKLIPAESLLIRFSYISGEYSQTMGMVGIGARENTSIVPEARFSKVPETFRARNKAILSSSISENGEVYTPETSCVKRTSVYIKNTRIKQRCNHKLRDFATAFRVGNVSGPSRNGPQGSVSRRSRKALWAQKVSGSFEKRAPGHFQSKIVFSLWVTIAVDHRTKTIRNENQLGSQPASIGHVKYQRIIKYLFRTSQREICNHIS